MVDIERQDSTSQPGRFKVIGKVVMAMQRFQGASRDRVGLA